MKSLFNLKLLCFSNIFKTSSVQPGYTVDSYIATEFFLRYFPTVNDAFLSNVKSGIFFLDTGVGTAIINTLTLANSFSLLVILFFFK